MRPNIQKRINDVANALTKGESRESIVAKFSKKFQTTPRTIDNYIAKAKEQSHAAIQEENELIKSDSTTKEVEARVEALITKEQLVQGLVSIFQNKTAFVKPSDQIAAAKQISTMLGFNEPSKTDVSISGDVKTVIQLFADQPPLVE